MTVSLDRLQLFSSNSETKLATPKKRYLPRRPSAYKTAGFPVALTQKKDQKRTIKTDISGKF